MNNLFAEDARMLRWTVDILEQHARGREIVIWGTGGGAEGIFYMIGHKVDISFFVAKNYQEKPRFYGKEVQGKGVLLPEKHFVVIASKLYCDEIRDELNQLGFRRSEDYFDGNIDDGTRSPFDVEYNGVPIGKCSYHAFTIRALDLYVESIGRFSSINGSVRIEHNHQMNMISTGFIDDYFSGGNQKLFSSQYDLERKKNFYKVKIGNDVWIGANVFINASTVSEIGDGAIIGAGAVVLEDVPPYAVVVGVPAKVKKYRFTPEQIEILLRVRWWEWDNETIDKNAELLIYPDKFFEKFGGE
jgi:aminocyclitol acetyltransferase